MKNIRIHWRLTLVGAIVTILPLLGCSEGLSPEAFSQIDQAVKQAREIAQENGVAWYVHAESAGEIAVVEEVRVGLDTGLTIEMHFQGNAQTEAAENRGSPTRSGG